MQDLPSSFIYKPISPIRGYTFRNKQYRADESWGRLIKRLRPEKILRGACDNHETAKVYYYSLQNGRCRTITVEMGKNWRPPGCSRRVIVSYDH